MPDSLTTLCLAGTTAALPDSWASAWSLAPATLLPLLALMGWLVTRARRGKVLAGAWLGWGLLVLALVSPLCRLAATLALAHMAQIMVIVAACALLATAPPPTHTTPRGLGAATVVHGLLLWLWHAPPVYAWTLEQPYAHVAAYALLISSGWWFWRGVLHGPHTGAALGALLATTLHTGLLGALLTFAPGVLYPLHTAGARAWGLDPLQDQQLAGLLMWVAGAIGYLGAAAWVARRWWPSETAVSPRGHVQP